MSAYILILAFILNDGSFKIGHAIIAECPTKEEVSAFMDAKVKAGEIKDWGGTCSPLVDPKSKEI